MAGRSVAQGGRDHTSHRLVALGLSERGAVLALWAMALGSGVVGGAVVPLRPAVHRHAGRPAARRLRRARPPSSGCSASIPDRQPRDRRGARAWPTSSSRSRSPPWPSTRRWSRWPTTRPTCCGSRARSTRSCRCSRRRCSIVLPCHVLMLGLFKTYQDSWRHAGLRDLMSLVGGRHRRRGAVDAGRAGALPLRELLARGVRDPLAAA